MICWNCRSTMIARSRDEYDNIELTCVMCGRSQIPPSYDTETTPDRATAIEHGLGADTTYRRKERARALANRNHN